MSFKAADYLILNVNIIKTNITSIYNNIHRKETSGFITVSLNNIHV